jgi:hypothetical protein
MQSPDAVSAVICTKVRRSMLRWTGVASPRRERLLAGVARADQRAAVIDTAWAESVHGPMMAEDSDQLYRILRVGCVADRAPAAFVCHPRATCRAGAGRILLGKHVRRRDCRASTSRGRFSLPIDAVLPSSRGSGELGTGALFCVATTWGHSGQRHVGAAYG